MPVENGYNLNISVEKVKVSGMKGFNGEMDKKTLKGNVGNGGAKIEINNTQQINLTFKCLRDVD